MSEQTKLSPEAQKALEIQAVQAKVNELTNISRLVVNTINLICSNDIKIPSSYAKPVSEIQDWLTGMHQNLRQNLEVMQSLLPKAPETVGQAAPAAEVAKQAVVDQGTDKAVKLEVVANDATAPKKTPKSK
jgi:lysophospholipase L1-like esterase